MFDTLALLWSDSRNLVIGKFTLFCVCLMIIIVWLSYIISLSLSTCMFVCISEEVKVSVVIFLSSLLFNIDFRVVSVQLLLLQGTIVH